jgi:alpha-glucuronidase
VTAIVGVANLGNADNLTGHHFSQANLFAFGRQAWDWTLDSEDDRSSFYAESGVAAEVSHAILNYRGFDAWLSVHVFQHHTEQTGAASVYLEYATAQPQASWITAGFGVQRHHAF